jgi:hypothetical protein
MAWRRLSAAQWRRGVGGMANRRKSLAAILAIIENGGAAMAAQSENLK